MEKQQHNMDNYLKKELKVYEELTDEIQMLGKEEQVSYILLQNMI